MKHHFAARVALAASAVLLAPGAAMAGPLDAIPVRIQVGNGLPPTTGGGSSLLGVSILSNQTSQGTAAGIRLLGSDKTAGLRITKLAPDGGAHQVGFDIHTGVDPVVSQLTTKP